MLIDRIVVSRIDLVDLFFGRRFNVLSIAFGGSMLRLLSILVTLTLIIIQTASERSTEPTPLAFTRVTLIDGRSAEPVPEMTVVVIGGRIAEVGRTGIVTVPKDARVFDATGKFLIPGLWDMHVHLSWTTPTALPVLLANGVTGVRDMGGHLGEIDEWQTKIRGGLLMGPRIVRAGPTLNGQKFNPLQMVAGNPDETRGVIRALKQVGVDHIKVHRRMLRDSYFAAVEEAKKQQLPLVGHIPMTVRPEEASDAGQATIEHTETLFEGTFTAALNGRRLADAIRQFRAEAAEKLFARFVKNGTVVTPTLIAYRSAIDGHDPTLPPDPRQRYVARSQKRAAQQRETQVSPEVLAELKETFAELREVVRLMNRSGVILITGSDVAVTRVPGFTLHDELVLFVDSGLTPWEALKAATLMPAKVVNRAGDLGSIEAGKIADLILLDANPLADIRNTQRIRAVIADGKLFDRAALDALLVEAARAAESN